MSWIDPELIWPIQDPMPLPPPGTLLPHTIGHVPSSAPPPFVDPWVERLPIVNPSGPAPPRRPPLDPPHDQAPPKTFS